MSYQRRPLSKLNSFNQNVIKVGYIVYYYNNFFRYDNSLYCTMPSGIMALCSWKFTIFYGLRSISPVVLIRIL